MAFIRPGRVEVGCADRPSGGQFRRLRGAIGSEGLDMAWGGRDLDGRPGRLGREGLFGNTISLLDRFVGDYYLQVSSYSGRLAPDEPIRERVHGGKRRSGRRVPQRRELSG